MNVTNAALLALLLSGPVAFAQRTDYKLDAWGVTRTPAVLLMSGQSISVAPATASGSDFSFAVEIYDSEKNLVARDDEESEAPAFDWTAPGQGEYYVLVRNLSGTAGSFTVTFNRSGKPRGAPAAQAGYAVVRVFYATNRIEAGRTAGGTMYGNESRAAGELAFGVANVSIPRLHTMGELEGPTILRLEFRKDPERHIVLLSAESEKPARFFQQVSAAAGKTPRREAFVFVHGFATSFEDAARRAGQMAYDLKFQGAPILYSWPSHGEVGLVAYNKDGRNAELSGDYLKGFLERLVSSADIRTVHLVAHSMGNRVVAAALDAIARDPSAARLPQLQHVALMAPDIDAEVFRRMADRIKGIPRGRMSLYASSGDDALRASQTLAGYARLGQGGADLVIIPGVDTLDASLVKTSLIGFRHSYYADNRAVLMDLFYFLRGTPIEERGGLVKRQTPRGAYWEIVPSAR